MNFEKKRIILNSKIIQINIFDISDSEDLNQISILKITNIILLIYDITQRRSFDILDIC